ncbi:unnamed protein product [Eruca vesicaria subsp. sativa]|uniref:Phytocyanin domain-containing protein n=1 Tax=Eruca vesicaria subsp. sativa TaxID=29727 RepID=A0ABC8LQJ6_ERUVS|nr:unnamed protein product [Eruca vesicaria subsp. sativa]
MASLILISPVVFLLFATFYHLGEANTFIVGGSFPGWRVPDPANNTLQHWADSRRFRVGDTLEFYYDSKNDSVLEVTKENYKNCITEKPLNEYRAEPTMVTLNVSGPHYFISGAPGHCTKYERLIVVVQSPNHPPMPTPKPVPGAAPPTPSSESPTSPTAPAPAPNTAVGLVAGSGIFWAIVAIIGFAWA